MLLLLAEDLTRWHTGFNVFSYLSLRAILAVMPGGLTELRP